MITGAFVQAHSESRPKAADELMCLPIRGRNGPVDRFLRPTGAETTGGLQSLNARNLLGNETDSLSMNASMTDAAMVYEASSLSAASGFGL